MKTLSLVLTVTAFFALQGVNTYATSGGSGTASDPFVLDQTDFEMDSGYYETNRSVEFSDGKFVKIGVSNKDNHLLISGRDTDVSAYVFMIGDTQSGAGSVAVSASRFDPKMLCVGRQGAGEVNVSAAGSVFCQQLLIGTDAGGSGSVCVSGEGSLLSVERLLDNAYYGEGAVEIDEGALVAVGCAEIEKSFVAGANGVIRLNGGCFAVYGNQLAGRTTAEIDAQYHFERKFSARWVNAGIEDFKVTYLDGVVNKWTESDLFAAYDGRIDLTGYTVITNDVPDYAWADATSSSKPGWYRSSWFGWFYSDETMNGWIFSPTHGYLYVSESSTSGETYFWDSSARKWWFTSRAHYPYLYNYSDETWCFYDKGEYPHRRFYEYRIRENVEESGLRK